MSTDEGEGMSAERLTTEELQRAILRGRVALAGMEGQGFPADDRILALVRAKQDRMEREYRARVAQTAERKGLAFEH